MVAFVVSKQKYPSPTKDMGDLLLLLVSVAAAGSLLRSAECLLSALNRLWLLRAVCLSLSNVGILISILTNWLVPYFRSNCDVSR